MAMWQATFETGGNQTKLPSKIFTDHRYSGLYISTGSNFFNIGKIIDIFLVFEFLDDGIFFEKIYHIKLSLAISLL